MTTALGNAFANSLAVAEARLAPLDGDAVTVAEALSRDAQVHLALAPQHNLVVLGIVHDDDGGVFLGQLVERLAELDVVLAFLGRNRDCQHWRIGLDLGNDRMGLLARGQRVAGLGLVELRESDSLAQRSRPALLARLADEFEYAGDAAGFFIGCQERGAI